MDPIGGIVSTIWLDSTDHDRLVTFSEHGVSYRKESGTKYIY
jgi:hypothetical protein